MSYTEEIINKGNETLEKFLFLLKEDIILFEEREQRERNNYSKDQAKCLLEKFSNWNNKVLSNEEVLLSNEEYFAFKDSMEKFSNFSKSQFLASNAHFVYLFALFDQFILEIAKLSLKNQPLLLKKYKEYCLTQYKRNQDQNLLDRLTEENELIDYFSHFSSPLKVFTTILEIDFKKAKFIEAYFQYIEMRERRNLIVHRGGIYDEIYFKTIKRYLSKFPQKELNKFLTKVKENKDKNLNVDKFYFSNAIRTLYFLVCLLVSSLISRLNSENQEIILFTHPFNELLNFSLETDYGMPLINTPLELFNLYESEYLNNDLSKMTDIDKVNWVLYNEKFKEIIQFAYHESQTQNLNDQEKREGEKIKEKLFKISNNKNKSLLNNIEDQLIKKIITAFLEKNYQTFTENIFLFAKRDGYLLEDIESGWYMHKKLSEEIEFREIYSSFKKENNFMPKNIILKMTSDNNQENQ